MKHRLGLPFLVFFLTLSSTALANTTWYVDGVNGSDSNNCKTHQHACKTIGHAISLASSGDSIMVAAATYTENLVIGISLRIVGSDAATTIIDGGHRGFHSVVSISKGVPVSLSMMTIQNGYAFGAGGDISNHGTLSLSMMTIQNGGAFGGGGIFNDGTLVINNVTVSGNHVTAIGNGTGGGISNGGALTINNSIISRNGASGGDGFGLGGGIFNARGGTVVINNSTISENGATGEGGGIYNAGELTISKSTVSGNGSKTGGGILTDADGFALMITNSTLSGNSASGQSGTVQINSGVLTISNGTISGNYGSGIAQGFNGAASLQNSIVATNSGKNCTGTITSNGYNLSSDNSCDFGNTGDLNNTDPKLGKLGDRGGPTQTMPLLSGSPAIDAGNSSGCTDSHGHLLKTDQRGKPRPDKKSRRCDMGAYERQKD